MQTPHIAFQIRTGELKNLLVIRKRPDGEENNVGVTLLPSEPEEE